MIAGDQTRATKRDLLMRTKINTQPEFDFQPSNLQVTNDYFARYEAISEILDRNSAVIGLAHRDLKEALVPARDDKRGGACQYTSDSILRILLCQILEGESLRGTVIRIDDSSYLRRFTRIYNGPMVDFTHLCRLKNCITAETWKKINEGLARFAVDEEQIKGDRLRIDTTAFETNIHWPTDSSLLWDTYRVLAREIERLREWDPTLVGSRHLQTKRVKRLTLRIARASNKRGRKPKKLKVPYGQLLGHVEAILAWTAEIIERSRSPHWSGSLHGLEAARDTLDRYATLGMLVVDQAQRRVLQGESVPNDEKIFSIFEEHTELLIRGKAGKPVEFGHMVEIEQVDSKFISGYDVYRKRPTDSSLVMPALERHTKLFGRDPKVLAADKGYYGAADNLAEARERVELVSIPKPGGRSETEKQRERSFAFKIGQQFRAGVEGSISFLKRALGMCRCLSKGWDHYQATVGATVFAHNLVVLARGYG